MYMQYASYIAKYFILILKNILCNTRFQSLILSIIPGASKFCYKFKTLQNINIVLSEYNLYHKTWQMVGIFIMKIVTINFFLLPQKISDNLTYLMVDINHIQI